jgi:hypothetical protein
MSASAPSPVGVTLTASWSSTGRSETSSLLLQCSSLVCTATRAVWPRITVAGAGDHRSSRDTAIAEAASYCVDIVVDLHVDHPAEAGRSGRRDGPGFPRRSVHSGRISAARRRLMRYRRSQGRVGPPTRSATGTSQRQFRSRIVPRSGPVCSTRARATTRSASILAALPMATIRNGAHPARRSAAVSAAAVCGRPNAEHRERRARRSSVLMAPAFLTPPRPRIVDRPSARTDRPFPCSRRFRRFAPGTAP